jgi:hypothetical protein
MVRQLNSIFWQAAILAAFLSAAGVARGQLAITEIMVNPGGDDTLWEWVELRNTSAAAVDLSGWIFQDDDGAGLIASNIQSTSQNTLVPAGGVAVLYPGNSLNFTPQRFLDAWGGGITLIGVNSFGNGLANGGDAIGLWPNVADYLLDALPGTTSPRRTFAHAAASVNYDPIQGFPAATAGRSIAWNGTGIPATAANWVSSANGALGAYVSVQTTLPGAAINDVADRGTPGAVPAGGAAEGLLISEVMYDPASAEPTWEWVEVFNNTGAPIDFGATPYVFDDDDDASLSAENVKSGTIAQGATAVLFNASPNNSNTLANMTAAWGGGVNFIPVITWTDLTNTGDTVALWSSLSAYQGETQSMTAPRRTTNNAAAVVAFDDDTMLGWPANNDASSIFLNNLTSNPATPASWTRANSTNSVTPQPVLGTVIDHPGNDIGSPGFVPGTVVTPLLGDYNGNGAVDAADYVVWRNALDTSTTLPNDETPGAVDAADYQVWRTNFGHAAGSGSATASTSVPEPAIAVLLLIGWAAICVTPPRSRRARR